jgi:hypothetical protein
LTSIVSSSSSDPLLITTGILLSDALTTVMSVLCSED